VRRKHLSETGVRINRRGRVLADTAPAALCRLNLTGRGVKSWNGERLDARFTTRVVNSNRLCVKSWNGERLDALGNSSMEELPNSLCEELER